MNKANLIDLAQGSEEWKEHRANHYNASEAAAAMGLSNYISRSELLRQKATGLAPEVDGHTQKRFDDGHANEAMARPWAEEIIGAELYPVTLSMEVDGLKLSASYDGITLDDEVTFEHKTLNAALEKSLSEGVIPDEYHPQMEQGLLISGATKCLFMASKNGDRETMRCAWYESKPEIRAQLLAAWRQVERDTENYEHIEARIKPVAEAITQLPAVSAQVSGDLKIADNLEVFEVALRDFLENKLIRSPQTDEDFANLESQIKTLEKAEGALDNAEATVLSMVSAVDAFKRTKDMLHAMARDNRLMAQKLLKAEKENRRNEILARGKRALQEHIASVNATLGKISLPEIRADFAGAMKGKRTITSLNDAVDTELARAKIEANAIADKIRLNLETLRSDAKGYESLFADAQQLALSDNEHLKLVIKDRIRDHKAAEEAKLEAERERVRAEEKAKAEAEAARVEAQRQREIAEAERARQQEQARIEREAQAKADEDNRAGQAAAAAANRESSPQPPAGKWKPGAIEYAAPAPAAKSRPTDGDIIETLCRSYNADEATVIDWLKDMDFSEMAA